MYRKVFQIMVVASCMSVAHAQNPIIRNQFTADPTARIFNGRIYLFPSHDIISPVEPEKRWFSMPRLSHVLIHRSRRMDRSWRHPVTGAGAMGKSESIFHVGTRLCGTQREVLLLLSRYSKVRYRTKRGFGIGVAIADGLFHPQFVPQEKPIAGVSGIDPCVMKATDGNTICSGVVEA